MEQIKTNNIISTPNIEGNIGSCETKSIDSKVSDSILTSQHTVIFTNSCTGQIVGHNTYTDYTGLTFLTTIGIIIGVVIFWAVIDSLLDKDYQIHY